MTMLRSESFVPLIATPPESANREFKVAVIPAQAQPAAFHSLERFHTDSTDKKKSCEPKVTVQREGDRITSIRVQCGCGQVMDIACVYDPSARPA